MSRRQRRGFTLIEIVVVMAVIAVLASIAIPEFTHAFKRARAVEAVQTMATLDRIMKDYFNANGEYPRVSGAQNPPSVHPGKASFDPNMAGWSKLDFVPEAEYQYRYSYTTTADANGRYTSLSIKATGDSDRDGNLLVIQHNFDDGAWVGEFVNDD